MSQICSKNGAAKRWCRDRGGAAVVELAVVLPVFVVILLGTIETCKMIFIQQSLEIAAYEAVRVAIVPETDFEDIDIRAIYSDGVNESSVLLPLPNQSARNLAEKFLFDLKERKFELNIYRNPLARRCFYLLAPTRI